MIITNDTILNLNPCDDRRDNYLKFYKGKSHTIQQFMGLKNITYLDKMWVGLRLLNPKDSPMYAADVAESVLHIFESKYPNDDRPRKAIEAARTGVNVKALRAADAADDAAHYATNATYAAYYAAKAADAANAAYYAANAADAADDKDRAKQEKLNRTLLIKYLMKGSK